MEEVKLRINEDSWLLVTGVALLLFQNTISEAVDGIMIFMGNDYNEDDVVMVDGEPGRIIRVGIWKTVFFIYYVQDGKIVGIAKLVVANATCLLLTALATFFLACSLVTPLDSWSL